MDSTLQPFISVKYFKSRARVAGLQLTYMMCPFVSRNTSFSDSWVQPFLGGSIIEISNIRFSFLKNSAASELCIFYIFYLVNF